MQKLGAMMRGSMRETAETVIDANSLRILGQEIHECENDMTASKQKLALIIAEKIQVKRDLDVLIESNNKHEKAIIGFLEEGNEVKANSLASIMAEQEPRLEQKQQHFNTLQQHETRLQATLKKTVLGLERFRNEYKMVKATATLQKAQTTLSNSASDSASRFSVMQESLDRIQEKQQYSADKIDAMEQVNTALSIDPLAQFDKGKPSAEDILKRIKAKQTV